MRRSLPLVLAVLTALVAALLILWASDSDRIEHASIEEAAANASAGVDVELATTADARDAAARSEHRPDPPGLVLRWRIDPANDAVVGLATTLQLFRWWTTDLVHEADGVFGADGWAEARLDALPDDWDGDWHVTARVRSDQLRLVTDPESSLTGAGSTFWATESYANVGRNKKSGVLELEDASRDGTIAFSVPAVVVRPLVAGRVVDATGRGVKGASVSFAPVGGPWEARGPAHVASVDGTRPEPGGVVRTSSDGTFDVLGSGFDGRVNLLVSTDDGRFARARDVELGTRDLVVPLVRSARVTGRLAGDAALLRVIDLALVSRPDGRASPLGLDPATGAFDAVVDAVGPNDLVWCVGRELLKLAPLAQVELVAGATTDLGVVHAAGAIELHAIQVIESLRADGSEASVERGALWVDEPTALVVLRSGERSRVDDEFLDARTPAGLGDFLSCGATSFSGWRLVSPHLVTVHRLPVSERGATTGSWSDACWPTGPGLVASTGVDWVVAHEWFTSDLFRGLALEGAVDRSDLPWVVDAPTETLIARMEHCNRLVRASRFAAAVGDLEAAADPATYLEARGFDPDADALGEVLLLASDGTGWTGEIASPNALPIRVDGREAFQVVRREPADLIGFDVVLPACPDGWRVGVRVLGLDGSDVAIEPGGIAFVPEDGERGDHNERGPARIRFATDREGTFRVLPVAWRADAHPRVWLEAPVQEAEEAARFPFAWEDAAGEPGLAPGHVEWPAALRERAFAVDVADGTWPTVDTSTLEELVANDAALRACVEHP